MLKKFLNIFCLASLIIFLFLITNYYFSEQNIIFTNKSRSKYSVSLTADNKNLPLLQNDTEFQESRLTAYTITLTDFITMQYSIQNSKSRHYGLIDGYTTWEKSTINNTELYLHLPLYKLWE